MHSRRATFIGQCNDSSLPHSRSGGGGRVTIRSTPERTTCVEDRLSWCSWWKCVPACATGSKEEDAEPSRRRLRSKDTLETVVVRCSDGSWPEADYGPSSTGQQWCTGFWSSHISSVPVGWCLRWRCDVWLSAGRVCSGSETPPAASSESEELNQKLKWQLVGSTNQKLASELPDTTLLHNATQVIAMLVPLLLRSVIWYTWEVLAHCEPGAINCQSRYSVLVQDQWVY